MFLWCNIKRKCQSLILCVGKTGHRSEYTALGRRGYTDQNFSLFLFLHQKYTLKVFIKSDSVKF